MPIVHLKLHIFHLKHLYPPPCPQGTSGVSLRFIRSAGLLVCCSVPSGGPQGGYLRELV